MSATFASSDWTDLLLAALRSSREVGDSGVSWVHGPLLLVIDAAGEAGLAGPVAVGIDVHAGEVRDVRPVDQPRVELWPFAIGGPYARWKDILDGRLNVIDAMMQSRLRVRGDLPTLHRHRQLLDAILDVVGSVPTTWPVAPEAAGAPAGR